MLPPIGDFVEIITGRDRRAGHQQQDLLERVNNAPRLTLVLEMRKVPQKQGQTRTRNLLLEDRVHDAAPMRIRAAKESHRAVKSNLAPTGR